MKFDRKHRPWLIISPILLAGGAVWYWRDAVSRPHGPSGGTFPGITFGIIGLAFMLFAALLSSYLIRPSQLLREDCNPPVP